jgi:hypothetical protein
VFLGKGDGTFKQHVKYALSTPSFIATADFNGDGILDLVFDYSPDGHHAVIALMLGKGDGTFGKVRTLIKPKGTCDAFAAPLVLNDFNGDGKLDIAFCQANEIGVKLGNGDGTFGKGRFYSIPSGQCAFSFAAGDFNSDNKTDLLVSYCNAARNDRAEYFLGNGDGTFSSKRSLKIPGGGFSGFGIVPGDFNGDGLLDFLFEFQGGFSIFPQE